MSIYFIISILKRTWISFLYFWQAPMDSNPVQSSLARQRERYLDSSKQRFCQDMSKVQIVIYHGKIVAVVITQAGIRRPLQETVTYWSLSSGTKKQQKKDHIANKKGIYKEGTTTNIVGPNK